MFEHSLLSAGLRFEEVVDAVVWHQDVQLFSVFDLSSGELMGYFYLDIYTRFIFHFVFNKMDSWESSFTLWETGLNNMFALK